MHTVKRPSHRIAENYVIISGHPLGNLPRCAGYVMLCDRQRRRTFRLHARGGGSLVSSGSRPPLFLSRITRCTVPSTARRTWPASVVRRYLDDDILGSTLQASMICLPLFLVRFNGSEVGARSEVISLGDHAN